jgi:hypothetical protein
VERAPAIKPCRRPGSNRQPGPRARVGNAPERCGLPLVLGNPDRRSRARHSAATSAVRTPSTTPHGARYRPVPSRRQTDRRRERPRWATPLQKERSLTDPADRRIQRRSSPDLVCAAAEARIRSPGGVLPAP